MEQQHQRIEHAVADVRAATAAWRSAPTPATAGALSHSLEVLTGVLDGHLVHPGPTLDRPRRPQRVGTPESAAMLAELPVPVKSLCLLSADASTAATSTRSRWRADQADASSLEHPREATATWPLEFLERTPLRGSPGHTAKGGSDHEKGWMLPCRQTRR